MVLPCALIPDSHKDSIGPAGEFSVHVLQIGNVRPFPVRRNNHCHVHGRPGLAGYRAPYAEFTHLYTKPRIKDVGVVAGIYECILGILQNDGDMRFTLIKGNVLTGVDIPIGRAVF